MTKSRPNTSIHQTRVNAQQQRMAAIQSGDMPIEQVEQPRSKLRLLPLLMIAAGLVLGFKLTTLYQQSDAVTQMFGGAPAVAQDEAASPEASQQAATPEAPAEGETVTEAVPPADPEDGPQLGEGRSLLENIEPQEQTAEASTDGTFDPTSLTQSEIDLLQSLAERRTVILQRESEVELRENLLQATEQRIDEKIAELKRIEETISSLIQTYDEEQEKQLQSLVKIYETMKPKAAAAIFETLEMTILLDVVERMKEAKLALILQSVTADRAKEITTELRARRLLPGADISEG